MHHKFQGFIKISDSISRKGKVLEQYGHSIDARNIFVNPS